jgi:hypothetical protein
VVLYGCKAWSRALTEEHRLKGFVNKVLKRIFVPKWNEVIGDWRKLNIKEFCNLYSSPGIIRINKSRRMRWVGRASGTHGGEEEWM